MKDVTMQGRSKGMIFPMALVLAGLVMFLARNGLVERQLLLQMLPLLPVAIGASLLYKRLRHRAG